ncbi:iron-containing alcohol dehydrogenase [Polaribacter sp.]|uniref:iron-containing alcohol dehydrogenase n=1 Tax=Polaribacter sp. TaxID=1920175 RepID=UPI003F6BF56E
MENFEYNTPNKIVLRDGCTYQVDTYKELKITGNILFVTDRNLINLNIATPVIKVIEKNDANVFVFDQVAPEPKVSTVRELVEFCKNYEITYVVGFGGGSPMDIAKIAAVLLKSPQNIEDIYGVNKVIGDRLPLALIPTTSGTGSEVTPVAVVTSDDGSKSPIVDTHLICDIVLLDAKLTTGLPPKITAATGVDAMVHAIEAYTSGVRKNVISDNLAKKAFVLLFNNIKTATFKGTNIVSRRNMLIGSSLAGLAFANSSVGAVHALSYPLGVSFNLPHGESNALVMIPVMRFNLKKATSLYADLSRIINSEVIFSSDAEAANYLINQIESLIKELNLSTKLSDYNITEKDINTLTTGTLKQSRLLSYNLTKMNETDISNIFKSIL